MENGGVVVKLGIYRVQGEQVAKNTVIKSWHDGEGGIKYDGEIMCDKFNAYIVGCTVTGVDFGTSDTPNLSLEYLFHEHMFPEISVLVAPGVYFEGYLPIFQGENSCLHICTWRNTARKWSGSGNPNLHRCRTWTTLTSLFSLQFRRITVIFSITIPTQWHLQTIFGERVSRSGMSWTLPQFLEASYRCTAPLKRLSSTRSPTHSYRHMISTLEFTTAFLILRMELGPKLMY